MMICLSELISVDGDLSFDVFVFSLNISCEFTYEENTVLRIDAKQLLRSSLVKQFDRIEINVESIEKNTLGVQIEEEERSPGSNLTISSPITAIERQNEEVSCRLKQMMRRDDLNVNLLLSG